MTRLQARAARQRAVAEANLDRGATLSAQGLERSSGLPLEPWQRDFLRRLLAIPAGKPIVLSLPRRW